MERRVGGHRFSNLASLLRLFSRASLNIRPNRTSLYPLREMLPLYPLSEQISRFTWSVHSEQKLMHSLYIYISTCPTLHFRPEILRKEEIMIYVFLCTFCNIAKKRCERQIFSIYMTKCYECSLLLFLRMYTRCNVPIFFFLNLHYRTFLGDSELFAHESSCTF